MMIRFPLALAGGLIADDHRIEAIRVTAEGATIVVSSYPLDRDVRVSGAEYQVPLAALTGETWPAAVTWLTGAGGPLPGGVAIADGAEPDLAQLRAAAIARVDAAAGAVRAKFITVVPGQEMTYLVKEQEARAYAGDPSGFPFLAAEAAATGMTVEDVAALVIAQANAWRPIGAAIEGLRRGAAVAIAAATTPAAIAAAANVEWSQFG